MKTITPRFQLLFDKLKLAEQVYEMAAAKVHNDPMTEQFSTLAAQKRESINSIAELLDLEYADHRLRLADRIRLEFEKAEIQFNHIFLRRNEGELMDICLKREEELIQVYEDIVHSGTQEVYMRSLLHSQLSDTKRQYAELEELSEAYHFADAS